MSQHFDAKITFIHAGTPQPEQKQYFESLLEKYGFKESEYKIIFKRGGINKTINELAESEHIDFVVTGALKREPLRKIIAGSISRNLARYAKVPVLLIPDAHLPVSPIHKIVIAI
ncbi:MAG: universal stress protein, partial [Bacteroidia bacterium]